MSNTMLMTEAQAAELLGFAPSTLRDWRYQGDGPRFVRVSARCIRYRRCDLDAWVESRVVTSTSEDVREPVYPS